MLFRSDVDIHVACKSEVPLTDTSLATLRYLCRVAGIPAYSDFGNQQFYNQGYKIHNWDMAEWNGWFPKSE